MKVDKRDSIVSTRIVGSKFFTLGYRHDSRSITKKNINEWFEMFNIDDYNIIKATGAQRIVSIEDVKEFRHAGYTFYRKDLYDLEHIENWIDFINKEFGCLCYMVNPLPPFSPNKIIIK